MATKITELVNNVDHLNQNSLIKQTVQDLSAVVFSIGPICIFIAFACAIFYIVHVKLLVKSKKEDENKTVDNKLAQVNAENLSETKNLSEKEFLLDILNEHEKRKEKSKKDEENKSFLEKFFIYIFFFPFTFFSKLFIKAYTKRVEKYFESHVNRCVNFADSTVSTVVSGNIKYNLTSSNKANAVINIISAIAAIAVVALAIYTGLFVACAIASQEFTFKAAHESVITVLFDKKSGILSVFVRAYGILTKEILNFLNIK